MNIWIFGDSFGCCGHIIDRNRLWTYFISKSLNKKIQPLAQDGSALEYLYLTYHNYEDQIQPDDIILIFETWLGRKWLFEKTNNISSLSSYKKHSSNFTADQNAFIDFSFKYSKKDVDLVLLNNFYSRLSQKAKTLNNKILVFPTQRNLAVKKFASIERVDSFTLNEVSQQEFINQQVDWSLFGKDPRPGHLSFENHIVFAKKITKFYEAKETVDLSFGFKKYFRNDNFTI